MEFDYYQYNISQHYASAIINGDESGLSPAEISDLNAFMAELPVSNGHFDVIGDESNFALCEVSNLHDDCLTFRLYFPLVSDWTEQEKKIKAIKEYAGVFYNEGWDVIVECWTNEDLLAELSINGMDLAKTLKSLQALVDVRADMMAEHQAEAKSSY
jgi:hypothetical protein